MGLFGKLFEKKVCDICGGDIGLLGNRKLEDGNCCRKVQQNVHRGLMNADKVQWLILKNRLSIAKKIK